MQICTRIKTAPLKKIQTNQLNHWATDAVKSQNHNTSHTGNERRPSDVPSCVVNVPQGQAMSSAEPSTSARCRSLTSSWTGNGSPFSVRRPWQTTETETNQNQTKPHSPGDTRHVMQQYSLDSCTVTAQYTSHSRHVIYCCVTRYIDWAVSHIQAVLVHNCLQGWTPVYLSSLDFVCRLPVSGRSWLHSADDNHFLVPRTQTVTFAPRAFSTSGPDAWNTLSSELRNSSVSHDCFNRSLKTFLLSS